MEASQHDGGGVVVGMMVMVMHTDRDLNISLVKRDALGCESLHVGGYDVLKIVLGQLCTQIIGNDVQDCGMV